MMMKVFWMTMCLATALAARGADGADAARGVIQRFAGDHPAVQLHLNEGGERENYSTEVKDGMLSVTANSPVALCHGYYAALKAQHKGICSWSGNRVSDAPWTAEAAVKGSTPFPYRYYFNVVTYGYTMPYWDWARWEQEIDYMALHGINAPLALVAQEAISARVFKKLGLTDAEIAEYFVGPAHLPWMRMGNISGIDGPMPAEWHEDQIALQHRILDRMRELGMKPICPGFAGFVPKALTRVAPDAKLVETSWCNGTFHNWMIMPDNPLFERIGTMFIQEWEKEFGKNEHYIIDSFNEMEVPFPPHGSAERYSLLADYGKKVYASIHAANPDAVWVMQGWMFGYQRPIWDSATLSALCSEVPDDKMLLLDEAVDYNMHYWLNGANWELHRGFYNKPWVYAVIPNMGGKVGPTGVLDFYANGHLAALASPNRGRLVGHGMAPEGTENNQVIYELMADAAWSEQPIDTVQWLKDYTADRYGKNCPQMDRFWQQMLKSVYGSFTDHPRFNWQIDPAMPGKGSINADAAFFKGVESFLAAAPQYPHNKLYEADLIEYMAVALGAKAEILICASEQAIRNGEIAAAEAYEARLTQVMTGMDRLLESHPLYRMQRWIDFARKHGSTPALKDYYEKNARRIVTIWGPPVDDYAARIWSGLVRDYYLPRRRIDVNNRLYPEQPQQDVEEWERVWVEEQHGLTSVAPYADPVETAQRLLQETADIDDSLLLSLGEGIIVGSWSPAQISEEKWTDIVIPCAAKDIRQSRAVCLRSTRGEQDLLIRRVQVEMDGAVVADMQHDGIAGSKPVNNVYEHDIPADTAAGNNGCNIIITVRAAQAPGSYGEIELLPREDGKTKN